MQALVAGLRAAQLESLEEVEVGVAWLERADPLVRARVEAAAAASRAGGRSSCRCPEGIVRRRSCARSPTSTASSSPSTPSSTARTCGQDRALPRRDRRRGRGGRARRAREYRERLERGLDGRRPPAHADAAVRRAAARRGRVGDLDVREALIRFTYPFNAARLAGARASVRHRPRTACPASVQLVGPPGDDALVLAAGRTARARRSNRDRATFAWRIELADLADAISLAALPRAPTSPSRRSPT